MSTTRQIAEWMWDEFVRRRGQFVQAYAARSIRQLYGEDFVYKNPNRNWAIRADILEEFRKLSDEDVVWSRSRQLWRRRRQGDPEGRMVR